MDDYNPNERMVLKRCLKEKRLNENGEDVFSMLIERPSMSSRVV